MPLETEENDIIIITEEEEGERLDKILANRFKDLYSRTYFQYLISEQLILLNGLPVKKRVKPQAGDEVEIEFVMTPEVQLAPENIPLDILYEDDDLLAINKPVGMVIHPAPGNWSGTFVNALLYHCKNLGCPLDALEGERRPGIVHRLDKETSGVLIAAKTAWMQQKLVELFASRKVYKEYLAICVGNPGEGEINAPIGRHPVHRKQMAVVPSGKNAISFCKILGEDGKLTVVKVVIATGRTHQIRVHLKYRGAPVLGDALYGQAQANQKYMTTHQFLHAAVLRLTHPATGQELTLKAQPPTDMLDRLRKIDAHWDKENSI